MTRATVSCGVLVLNRHGELLLCHATGAAHWDIPKGIGEPGETARQTAVRETAEETGLRLDPESLLELGRFAYRRDKDLQLFAVLIERIDPASCTCTSLFLDRSGREQPEADAFEWTPFDLVERRCARSMSAVLTRSLSLPDVLRRLSPP